MDAQESGNNETSKLAAASAVSLGDQLQAKGKLPEAIGYYQQAVKFDKDSASAWFGLGYAQLSLKQFSGGIKSLRKCLSINEDIPLAWLALGNTFAKLEYHATAIICFEQCVERDPKSAEACYGLGQSLFTMGQIDPALAQFREATVIGGHDSQGNDLAELARKSMAVLIPGSPKTMNQDVLDCRKEWVASFTPAVSTDDSPKRPHGKSPRPLRIGYVSAFFHQPNWMKPVFALINRHDRSRFTPYLFADGASDSPAEQSTMAGYLANKADRWFDTTELSNRAMADLIRAQEIDVLVDLNGYSRPGRLPLFNMQPAGVIAGWFNFYATTGMLSFDYLIGDTHVIPAEEEPFYSEQIVRVPGSYLTFEVNYPVPDVAPPPSARNGTITFGCLASQYKITDGVLDAWAQILLGSPSSRLLLKNASLKQPETHVYLAERFASRGVDPDRIRCEGPADHYAFLARYREIDIALDTFPYNGGTTTTEAIWQGVPVITYHGDRWAERTSATILRCGNLGEWVRSDRNDYVEYAIQLANSPNVPERLTDLRNSMRSQLRQSTVCDADLFAYNMEQIFVQLLEDR